jgi:DnaK suppressor protein
VAKKVRSTKAKGKSRKPLKAAFSKALKKKAAPAAALRPTVALAELTKGPRLKKSPLSKAELKEFRLMLLEKRRSLIGDMTGMANEALRTNRQESSGDLSKIPTHDADVGTDNFEQEFTLGLLESERTLLTEINEALERIDNGTYGICLGTGRPISKGRLKARPWAKYCIEYAHLIEQGAVSAAAEREEQGQEEEAEEGEAEEVDEVEEEALPEELPDSDKQSEE